MTAPPPLTEGVANELTDFVEWVLEIRLPPEARAVHRSTLIYYWQHSLSEPIAICQNWLAFSAELKTLSVAERAYQREALQPHFVAGMRANIDEFSRWCLHVYDANNPVVAPGNPPLTRKMCDRSLDLFGFMQAVVEEGQPVEYSPQHREAWAHQLAGVYPSLDQAAQQWFQSAPLAWAGLGATWNAMPHEEQAAHQRGWATQVPLVASIMRAQVPAQPATLPAQPAPVPARGPAPLDFNRSFEPAGTRHAASTQQQLLNVIREEQQKKLERAAAHSPELQLQQQMMNDQMLAGLLSNMSHMSFETTMNIVRNIR